MTDLEKFIELYKSVGIPLKPDINGGDTENGYQFLRLIHSQFDSESTPLTIGYYDFYTDIYFDEDGKFIQQGIWE